MNMNCMTIQDCMDMHTFKGKAVILNDGKVVGFREERDERKEK